MLASIQKTSAWSRPIQVAWAANGVLIALLIQLPFEVKPMGGPFTVFVICVFISTLLFGRLAGWMAVTLSVFLSALFFEPVGSFQLVHVGDLAQIELYALVAAVMVLIVDKIHRIILAQATANDTLVTESRHKSLQLREVAHRVANNFTSLDALLRQRAMASNDPKVKFGFEQASELVHIVARLNNRLSILDRRGIIDSQTSLAYVCDDLEACAPANIRVVCEAESHMLPLTWVISLGLIINELVTNSIKYAFPDNRDGTIRVAFSRDGNFLRLLVEDDGVGTVGKVKDTGMGFPLLQAFSENLKWTIEQRSDEHGTETSALLPYDAEKETSVDAERKTSVGEAHSMALH
jgi:two-component system, sensor histidine kinase PdtaS